jgi:hypothetical protein
MYYKTCKNTKIDIRAKRMHKTRRFYIKFIHVGFYLFYLFIFLFIYFLFYLFFEGREGKVGEFGIF